MKVTTLDESLHSTYDGRSSINIGWREIQIREYSRTVGDNPSCSSGPPLTIDWEFNPKSLVMSVDGYEKRRPPRKSQFEMVLPREERQEMLMDEWRISQTQIASAVRANIKAKNQRRRTVNNLGKMTKIEEISESVQRKTLRLVTLQKSASRQVKEMNKKSEAADAQRRQLWAKMGPPKKPPPPPPRPPQQQHSHRAPSGPASSDSRPRGRGDPRDRGERDYHRGGGGGGNGDEYRGSRDRGDRDRDSRSRQPPSHPQDRSRSTTTSHHHRPEHSHSPPQKRPSERNGGRAPSSGSDGRPRSSSNASEGRPRSYRNDDYSQEYAPRGGGGGYNSGGSFR
eukprot:CAMPEP_0202456352 /NCGR_PEP_ID=MMETSP1360-20130828/13626_1 /ASSEMBLY_ACC=CAM_ASM_000848 /TAXON_ID=515479 /ORGANISM="Licmophora paradoxa, Strain CCMP2313" /LENGTH=338 /DNA_ID=CAMNT_0049076135 /DNA_START=675 /DNA_END=1691 /DNA_ORIENTATION=+